MFVIVGAVLALAFLVVLFATTRSDAEIQRAAMACLDRMPPEQINPTNFARSCTQLNRNPNWLGGVAAGLLLIGVGATMRVGEWRRSLDSAHSESAGRE